MMINSSPTPTPTPIQVVHSKKATVLAVGIAGRGALQLCEFQLSSGGIMFALIARSGKVHLFGGLEEAAKTMLRWLSPGPRPKPGHALARRFPVIAYRPLMHAGSLQAN